MSTSEVRVERVQAPLLYELRRRILRGNDPEVDVVDPLDDESTSLHFGGFVDDRVVVSASFFPAAAPIRGDLVSYQLRYMATDFVVQGKGYGAKVQGVAFSELRALGAEQVWAKARDSALGFYCATGWSVVEGSEHLSPLTKLPHHVIIRILADDA